MTKIDAHRTALLTLSDWESYLQDNSYLPGPRANLELAWAVSQMGTAAQFDTWLDNPPELAPENTPGVFLVVCGALGLGELLAAGQLERLAKLRRLANDPRWRVREAVAMALQRWGRADLPALLYAMQSWVHGEQAGSGQTASLLELRAAAAALCEPALLSEPIHTQAVLGLLDEITAILARNHCRRSDDFRVLRKGLAYCWSVAIAACPKYGRPLFECWLPVTDPDIHWMLHQNLKKKRLLRMDPNWAAECLSILENKNRK